MSRRPNLRVALTVAAVLATGYLIGAFWTALAALGTAALIWVVKRAVDNHFQTAIDQAIWGINQERDDQ